MPRVHRVLDPSPVERLQSYVDSGGGRALEVARQAAPADIIDVIEASGLRGRGGGGFPTGIKWRTVAEHAQGAPDTTVVVNAAEGEPGTYKDRAILLANPYRVIEGALVAAVAIDARRVVIAFKASFEGVHQRLQAALAEAKEAGWVEGVDLDLVAGPDEYLYGEETALLEVIAGRHPFPRLSPPYKRGVEGEGSSAFAADAQMANALPEVSAPPALVNNVESFANVPGIVCNGAEWFRSVGTEGSPGTIVCTVSGECPTEGFAEYAMGTPVSEVLVDLGGFTDPATEVGFVLSGVANPFLTADRLDTPLDHDAMQQAGAGLGTGGFLVFSAGRDPVAVAAGVSRFLGIESCGQCTPCKQDGMALFDLLEGLRSGTAEPDSVRQIEDRANTVAVESRCFLATQHELVVTSLLQNFAEKVAEDAAAHPVEDRHGQVLIAPIKSWDGERFTIDSRHGLKQADWTFNPEDSGQAPADRIDQARELPEAPGL